MTTTVTSATSLAPLQIHLPTDPPVDPNALGHALLAAEERLQEGDDQMLDLAFAMFLNIGKKIGKLEDEKARLQSDISLQQRQIETLEMLHQEKWSAHLDAARVRMKPLADATADFVRSFREFKASFPGEAISQIQENVAPNLEWVTTLGSFVKGCPAKCLLPPKEEVAYPVTCLTMDQTLFAAASIRQTAPHIQQMRRLEEDLSKLKGELRVLEAGNQQLVKHNALAIESWNRVVEPYRNMARLFQEKIATFLQQKHSAFFHRAQGTAARDLTYCNIKDVLALAELTMVTQTDLVDWGIVERIDKAFPLQKKIDAIVPLIEGMMFKKTNE